MATLYRTLTGQSQKSHQSEQSHVSKPVSLQRTTTTDPYSGVLNHLTEPQAQKLDLFKDKLEKDGWWTREGSNGRPSHDDGTLLYVNCSLRWSSADMPTDVTFEPANLTSTAHMVNSLTPKSG
jgi:hypothetical protein